MGARLAHNTSMARNTFTSFTGANKEDFKEEEDEDDIGVGTESSLIEDTGPRPRPP